MTLSALRRFGFATSLVVMLALVGPRAATAGGPSRASASLPGPLVGVDAIAADDVWAVGNRPNPADADEDIGLAEHWDGTAWAEFRTPGFGELTAGLVDVSMSGPSDGFAVGSSGPAILPRSADRRGAVGRLGVDRCSGTDQSFDDVLTGVSGPVTRRRMGGRRVQHGRHRARSYPDRALEREPLEDHGRAGRGPGGVERGRRPGQERRVGGRLRGQPHADPALGWNILAAGAEPEPGVGDERAERCLGRRAKRRLGGRDGAVRQALPRSDHRAHLGCSSIDEGCQLEPIVGRRRHRRRGRCHPNRLDGRELLPKPPAAEKGLAEHFTEGGGSELVPVPGIAGLAGVVGLADDDIWAVGPGIYHWNGTVWRRVARPA